MGRTVPSRSFNCKKMSSKTKNLIVRTITGVLFIAIMVSGFLRPQAMVFLFSLITGLTIWEYCSLVNELKTVTVNRFIATVAGIYFFLAVAGINSGYIQTNGVFVPYLLTIVYLFVSELYTRNENAIHDWAYTMLSQMYIALPFSMINVLAFRQAPDGDIIIISCRSACLSFCGRTTPVLIAVVRCWANTSYFHVSHLPRAGKAALAVLSSYSSQLLLWAI